MINHAFRSSSLLCLAACAGFAAQPAVAATTDIAPAPLETSAQTVVKPNLMLILDDSGSMGWKYMPDGISRSKACYGFSGYNRVFFDPNGRYPLPVDASGNTFPVPSFTSAWEDGFNTSGGTTDLSDLSNLDTPALQVCTGSGRNQVCTNQRFYYATYSGNKPLTCEDNDKYTPIRTLDAAQQQKYAIWYSYYRTRMQMMKSAVGLVFKGVSSNYRVGFTTISDTGVRTGSTFLDVSDFDSTQRGKFYEKLYAADPGGSTPLRAALSKVGRYYARTASDDQVDPVQYSCQKNFTILSTDGYWNDDDETSSYGPFALNGRSNVGDVDTVNATTPTPAVPFNGRIQVNNKWIKGNGNTLADVAYYYYVTDLRNASQRNCAGAISGVEVCENNVPAPETGQDTAVHQHMTTFSLGLGVNGTLPYLTNYEQASSGAYWDITQGTGWWPDPISNSGGARIDDLWHAAVNGRGRYYSASDASSVVAGLTDALTKINAERGSSAAAATSTLQPVSGNNAVYVAQYRTKYWVGDLVAYAIDPLTGVVNTAAPSWSAAAKLRTKSPASRNIYFASQTNAGLIRAEFKFDQLGSTLQPLFSDACSKAPALSQCATTLAGDSTALATANNGEAIVNWLRGEATYEAGSIPILRKREERLGDIVNASPVFVAAPPFNYVDRGYADFKNRNADRAARIYTAANDGMLHAFDKEGNEAWAYVPRAVMPNLYRLADANYVNNHIWTVDGSPVVGDVYERASTGSSDGSWRTILVGGLNGGGRSYYALDVTSPNDPRVLWEFSDSDLGLTFGNPVITKRADGRWVVIFTSGYNNVSPGTGNGYLYVLDAVSGTQLLKIPTFTSGTLAAGNTSTPSGLARINNWVDNDKDNTTKRVYGGDLLGNLWRFDLDNLVAPNQSALLLAQVRTGGVGQAITTKPELTEVRSGATTRPVVVFGTGRLLGTGDLADTQTQSIYAVRDPLTSRGWGEVRTQSGLKSRMLVDATDANTNAAIRTISGASVDFTNDIGWYIDLPTAGERINVDPQQQLNILTLASNIPSATACTAGGDSWLYSIDIGTGLAPISLGTTVGQFMPGAFTAGLRVVELATGRTQVIVTNSKGEVFNKDGGAGTSANPSAVRRTSWRELID